MDSSRCQSSFQSGSNILRACYSLFSLAFAISSACHAFYFCVTTTDNASIFLNLVLLCAYLLEKLYRTPYHKPHSLFSVSNCTQGEKITGLQTKNLFYCPLRPQSLPFDGRHTLRRGSQEQITHAINCLELVTITEDCFIYFALRANLVLYPSKQARTHRVSTGIVGLVLDRSLHLFAVLSD